MRQVHNTLTNSMDIFLKPQNKCKISTPAVVIRGGRERGSRGLNIQCVPKSLLHAMSKHSTFWIDKKITPYHLSWWAIFCSRLWSFFGWKQRLEPFSRWFSHPIPGLIEIKLHPYQMSHKEKVYRDKIIIRHDPCIPRRPLLHELAFKATTWSYLETHLCIKFNLHCWAGPSITVDADLERELRSETS